MQNRERLSSRLGFILLSAGCAIGCGNVWKFFVIIACLMTGFNPRRGQKRKRGALGQITFSI